MKPGLKVFLGLMTGLLVISFIVTWDLVIKDQIDSERVVVVRPGVDIQKNEVITKDKIVVDIREKKDLVPGVILESDLETIIGKDAAHLIQGNSMITDKMVDFEDLVPNEENGEAIRPLNKEMIFAAPGSLRRKDEIDIYFVPKELYENGSAQMYAGPVLTEDQLAKQSQQNSPEAQQIEINENEIVSLLQKPLLENVKVVYAKDSSNNEVLTTADSKDTNANRLDATGRISELEVILNEEQFQLLMEKVLAEKAKLYITYN